MKQHDPRGWLFVAPACLLLGVVGLIPLVTVINYSFFEIFTLQSRFWIGTEWFRDLITA
ncbi:MAG TPA: ABC transporter permease, partial [Sulfitobacter sp.]|nr:ABC transporter permease [Sulfitobacter sp.]